MHSTSSLCWHLLPTEGSAFEAAVLRVALLLRRMWLCMLAAQITHGLLLFMSTYDFMLQLLRLQVALAVWTMNGDVLSLRLLSHLHSHPACKYEHGMCCPGLPTLVQIFLLTLLCKKSCNAAGTVIC